MYFVWDFYFQGFSSADKCDLVSDFETSVEKNVIKLNVNVP